MTEISVEIVGIIVNVIIGVFNVVFMIWLGKKQIHATLQTAQPTPKPKRKRKMTRAQRRWVWNFRLLQFFMMNDFIVHGYPDYLIWCCGERGKLRIIYLAVSMLAYLGAIGVTFQSQWYIRRIKARDRAVLIWLGALKPHTPKHVPDQTIQPSTADPSK